MWMLFKLSEKIPAADYLTDRVDFASFSGHKFHSVRGVGFIYKKRR